MFLADAIRRSKKSRKAHSKVPTINRFMDRSNEGAPFSPSCRGSRLMNLIVDFVVRMFDGELN